MTEFDTSWTEMKKPPVKPNTNWNSNKRSSMVVVTHEDGSKEFVNDSLDNNSTMERASTCISPPLVIETMPNTPSPEPLTPRPLSPYNNAESIESPPIQVQSPPKIMKTIKISVACSSPTLEIETLPNSPEPPQSPSSIPSSNNSTFVTGALHSSSFSDSEKEVKIDSSKTLEDDILVIHEDVIEPISMTPASDEQKLCEKPIIVIPHKDEDDKVILMNGSLQRLIPFREDLLLIDPELEMEKDEKIVKKSKINSKTVLTPTIEPLSPSTASNPSVYTTPQDSPNSANKYNSTKSTFRFPPNNFETKESSKSSLAPVTNTTSTTSSKPQSGSINEDQEEDSVSTMGENENIGQTVTTSGKQQHQYIQDSGQRNIRPGLEADTSQGQTKHGYKPEYFQSLKSLNSLLEMLENGTENQEAEQEKSKVIHIPIVMENGGKISNKHNEANKNKENDEAVSNHNNLNDSLEAVESTSSATKKNSETKDVVTKYSKTESVCTQSDNCENKTMDSRQFTSTVNENLNGRCDNRTDASIRVIPIEILNDTKNENFKKEEKLIPNGVTSSSKAPELGGDQKISDWGNKKMINVPIKIETEDDNNLESSTSISAKTDISHPNHLSNGKDVNDDCGEDSIRLSNVTSRSIPIVIQSPDNGDIRLPTSIHNPDIVIQSNVKTAQEINGKSSRNLMSESPAHDIANDLAREDIQVDKIEDFNIDNSHSLKDFQTIHVQLEDAKKKLESQLKDFKLNETPKKSIKSKPPKLESRSKSVGADTRGQTNSRLHSTSSNQYTFRRERSLEDINKDIETIWKELQEIDKITRSSALKQSEKNDLPELSDQQLVIPSWRSRDSNRGYNSLYRRPSINRNTVNNNYSDKRRNVSLPPSRPTDVNQAPNQNQNEAHQRITSPDVTRNEKRGRPFRSTIWDFPGENNIQPEQVQSSSKPNNPLPEKVNGNYSFVPKKEIAPGASSPEFVNIESTSSISSRQSRSRTRKDDSNLVNGKTKTSAFQQLWPQTYNSFQNRAKINKKRPSSASGIPPTAKPEDITPSTSPVHKSSEKDNSIKKGTKESKSFSRSLIRISSLKDSSSSSASSPPTLKSCLKPESRTNSLGRNTGRSSSPGVAAKVNFKQEDKDPISPPTPILKRNPESFDRNYSGTKSTRNIPISIKSGMKDDKNPFLNNDDDSDRIEVIDIRTNVDCYACDVSTQTEIVKHKKDNCKLM